MIQLKIDLIKTKVEILKLKADQYEWQCHIPDNVKAELEATLIEINLELEKLASEKA